MDQKFWTTLVLLVFNIVGFSIMLGGVVVLQATCRGSNQPKDFGDGGLLDPALNCAGFHQYQWFKVLWQGFLLLLNTAALVTGLLPIFNHTLSILRGVATLLLMDAANDYLSVLRTSKGELRRDSAVFFAGLIISIIDNLLLIVMLSSNWDLLAERRSSKAGSSSPSSAKQRPPDEEAPAADFNAAQTNKQGQGASKHPRRSKQHKADAEPPGRPAIHTGGVTV